MAQRVVVVTDSGAALPAGLESAYNIRVVPMRLAIGDEVYTEGLNISPPRVVAALISGERVRVFEPPSAEIAAAYRTAAILGAEHVVSVHISSGIHHVVPHAAEAAAHAPIPVTVIDTKTIALAQGFVALAAAAVAREGGDVAQVVAAAHAANASARLLFTVDTLEYVHRDGRVPGIVKAISNASHMRPLLSTVDGQIKLVGRVRNTGPARERVKQQMTDAVAGMRNPAVAVALVGGSALELGLGIDAPGMMREISPGASLTAHAGPGTYVVAAADMPKEFAE